MKLSMTRRSLADCSRATMSVMNDFGGLGTRRRRERFSKTERILARKSQTSIFTHKEIVIFHEIRANTPRLEVF